LRYLSRNGHTITLFTTWTGEEERGLLEEFRAQGVTVVAAPLSRVRSTWNSSFQLFKSGPLQAAYCWHPVLAREFVQRVRIGTFDVVHIEHLRGARYGLYLKHASAAPPIVWDSVDCISGLFEHASSQSS